MKKLMTAFAACMIAGLVSAQVESQNVVGYQAMDLGAGFNMLGLNFQEVGGTTVFDIQGVDNPLIDVNEIAADIDVLQIFDTATQKFKAYTMYPVYGSPDWDGQWTEFGVGTLTPLTLTTGQGFLFNASGAKTLTFKGQADFVETVNSFNFAAGFNTFGSQFPADFDFNSEVVAGAIVDNDVLQLFDPLTQKFTAYTMYPVYGSPDWDGQWTEFGVGTLVGPLVLGMGEGALYNRDAAGVGTPVEFSRPY